MAAVWRTDHWGKTKIIPETQEGDAWALVMEGKWRKMVVEGKWRENLYLIGWMHGGDTKMAKVW